MKYSIGWGSHMAVLSKIISITDGPVLELGGGFYSTPLLHWLCLPSKRELITYDNLPNYFNAIERYNSDFHKVIFTDDWDKINIERYWDVVFVDHWPAERRKEEIKRVANLAKYVVVHDTENSQNHHYHYDEIYPLFKYNFKYRGAKPHTSILSNFVDINNLKI